MRKFLVGLSLVLATIALAAQGTGTPNTLRVKTDANNSLMVSSATQVNPISQPTLFSNTRLRTDASGNLIVVLSGGSGGGATAGACPAGQVMIAVNVGSAPTCTSTVNAGTITTDSPFTFSQTWNNVATLFNGFVINTTNTASNGNSRAFKIVTGGVEEVYVTAGGSLGAQAIDANVIHSSVAFQLGPGGQYLFSDGADYGAGLSRPAGAVIRTTDGSTGYGEHQAQDFRLVPNGATKPTCAAGIRGTLWYTSSGAGVPDAMEVCAKSTLDAYAWRSMATIP